MYHLKSILLGLALLPSIIFVAEAQSDKRDKGEFIDYKNEFMDKINSDLKDWYKERDAKKNEKTKTFKVDYSRMKLPKSIDEFKKTWFNPPISQGLTGTCWCFSTVSYFETEIFRIHGKKIKISEMFTVYTEYLEKARRFVRERGDSRVAEGSEANAVIRNWAIYGCMPAEAYSGMQKEQPFHDHSKMIGEINSYLQSIKKSNTWDEELTVKNVKAILDYYLTPPPQTFVYNGRTMTPPEFFEKEVKLNPKDYVEILSLLEKPYWEQVVYPVEDNWWMSDEYYNVPLDEFMIALKSAVKAGYGVSIGGDVSEPGYDSRSQCAIIPTFDIPSEYIDEQARQFRFTNKTTGDDHGVHLVGYKEQDGKFWFLIKDSGSGSRNGMNKGHYFWHEDYIKLKMMNYTIHRSAVEDLLKKFKK